MDGCCFTWLCETLGTLMPRRSAPRVGVRARVVPRESGCEPGFVCEPPPEAGGRLVGGTGPRDRLLGLAVVGVSRTAHLEAKTVTRGIFGDLGKGLSPEVVAKAHSSFYLCL